MQDKFQLVSQMLADQEPQKAEIYISRLLRMDLSRDQIVELLTYRAHAQLLGNNPERALRDIATVVELMPSRADKPDIQELIADANFAKYEQAAIGFTDKILLRKAQQGYETLLHNYPTYENLGWILYQYGRTHLITDNVRTALECFQKALNSPSRQYALKAYCYERMGFIEYYNHHNFSQALDFLNLAVAIYPTDADAIWLVQAHLLRSRVFHASGEYTASAQAVDTAIGIAESRINQKSVLSEAYFAGGELMAQLDAYENRAIQLLKSFTQSQAQPTGVSVTWSRASEMLADLYVKVNRFGDAVEAYRSALKFNPYHPWGSTIRYHIAKCYYQMGRYKEVTRTITDLLIADTREKSAIMDYRVYDVLGNAYFALEQYDDAVDAYAKALSLAPEQADGIDKIKLYYHFSKQLAGQSEV